VQNVKRRPRQFLSRNAWEWDTELESGFEGTWFAVDCRIGLRDSLVSFGACAYNTVADAALGDVIPHVTVKRLQRVGGAEMAQTTAEKRGGLVALLKEAAWEWNEDKTLRLGAALAYYAVFSLAPLLLLSITVAGLVYGEAAASGQLFGHLEGVAGHDVARAIEESLGRAHVSGANTWAAIVAFVMALVAAAGLFGQLQDALNDIWDVEASKDRSWLQILKGRLMPFLMVLVCGALLFSLLLVNSLLTAADRYFPQFAYFRLWGGLDLAITLALVTLLNGIIYKILPDVSLRWKDVWIGAAVTAVLLILGNWLIGLYLGWSGVASVYGAAGSLVVILMWVYYSSQAFLFGAELTHTYALRSGSAPSPKPHAAPIPPASHGRHSAARN
jgi:membrane protein